jgi:4-amino-4-deoxy-L-arabinose transferase-like glycosyltransferase
MKSGSKLHDERGHYLILTSVVLAAFAVRLGTFLFTISIPGDGPARATRAYVWSQSPFFRTRGLWLWGYEYLVGTFGHLLGDPLLASRLLNLLLGTCTVLLFYLLVRKVFDPVTGLISAAILAFLPLHIGLSAGTLTEVSFAFEVVAGVLFLIAAAESETAKGRAFSLASSLVFLCLAGFTRYEAWVLVPLFPCYYFWKTRKFFMSLVIAAVLIAFPLFWMLSNYFYAGSAFGGFTRATGWHHGARPVGPLYALLLVKKKSLYHLGWIVPILAVIGIGMQLFQTAKMRVAPKRVLYILIACIFWAGVLVYALARGIRLWDRYLLFAFLMALPFAAMPLSHYAGRDKKRTFTVILMTVIVVVSVVYKPGAYDSLYSERNFFYVTLWRPKEIEKIADWLKKSPYRDSPVLLTRLQGQSSYLSFYFPEAASRRFIIKNHAAESYIRRILKSRRPALFITDRDGELQFTSEKLLGEELKDMLVHKEGFIRVYDISSAVNSNRF